MKESIYLLSRRLKGLQTVESVQKELNIKRSTAIKKLHLLRKAGFVETSGGGKQPRFYRISSTPQREIGFPGLYDTINKYSRVKIMPPYRHRMVGKKLSVEEALVRAVATRDFRTILASLALFNYITDWSRLYTYAKKFGVRKRIGALYDVAKAVIKVRKMDKRISNKLLASEEKEKFIIPLIKSKNFVAVQKKWGVYAPFNRKDLWRYKK